MIAIDNVLLSEEVVEENFVCDLEKCKGACCIDGDCGAPLTHDEALLLQDIYPSIRPYLLKEYAEEIDRQGTHVMDAEHGEVTPSIKGGICAYGYTDDAGVVTCGIEKAFQSGAINFRKPVSCHLFPIRITQIDGQEMVNYEPRTVLCRPACRLGNRLKIPVYQFLKDAIVRKYGDEFYEALDAVAAYKRQRK